jgi:hypothetical protein
LFSRTSRKYYLDIKEEWHTKLLFIGSLKHNQWNMIWLSKEWYKLTILLHEFFCHFPGIMKKASCLQIRGIGVYIHHLQVKLEYYYIGKGIWYDLYSMNCVFSIPELWRGDIKHTSWIMDINHNKSQNLLTCLWYTCFLFTLLFGL